MHTMEYYLALKNNEMWFAAAFIDLEINHFKQSRSKRERQLANDITYMWNLNYYKNELTCETETDSQR